MAKNTRHALSRRGFLLGSGALAGSLTLAACGPNADPPAGGASSGSGELEFLWRNLEPEEPVLKELIAQFMSENEGITVNETYVPIDGYDQRVDLLIAGGTPPAVWGSLYNRGLRYYASRDQMTPLDDYVADSSIDLGDYTEAAIELSTWDGQLLSVPNEALTVALVYNKTMFEEAGVPLPPKDWGDRSWTWDAFLEAAQALTQGTDQFGFQGWQDPRYELANFGVNLWDDEGDVTGYPTELNTSPELIEAIQFMGDLINRHKVQPDASQTEALASQGLPDLFVSGTFGMKVTFMGAIATYATIEDFEWGIAAIPAPVSLPRRGYQYLGNLAIPLNQPDEQAAFRLLEFLASAESQARFPIAAQNWMSSKLSLAGDWTSTVSAATGVPAEELAVFQESQAVSKPAFGAYAVEWQQLWDTVYQPQIESVTLGRATAAEAVAAMQEPFDRVVANSGGGS
ncbi:ABC transporter substrate-binding protein [Pseudactinotalea suaedae]|uniref:ABC transporter substrate-binding protein n=1 Tax=Pseudactinotalea suaedae TaxID=1524924 RepID=UPI0012E148FF|nr:extracellular solute-binding protein [Pseudactinotalea suaedae]